VVQAGRRLWSAVPASTSVLDKLHEFEEIQRVELVAQDGVGGRLTGK